MSKFSCNNVPLYNFAFWFSLEHSVLAEVRRTMGFPGAYDMPCSSKSLAVERTPTPSSRSALTFVKGKGSSRKGAKKKTASFFQKPYVAFCYMGRSAPRQFTRIEGNIVASGVLPPISTQASEEEVREILCNQLRASKSSGVDLSECLPSDFEFVSMKGKKGSIPDQGGF